MRQLIPLLITVMIAFLAAACSDFKLPDDQEVREIFVSTAHKPSLEPRASDNVPVMAIEELEDWHTLCDKCHRGPDYSSNTILRWRHKHECIAGLACNQCHKGILHDTDLKGNKARCYDCHISRSLTLECSACHTEGCQAENVEHPREFLDDHGQQQDWQGVECFVCHGHVGWCTACHGVVMPHPEDNLVTHPQLVQGDPARCTKCHGLQSCTNCHNERGITVKLQVPGL